MENCPKNTHLAWQLPSVPSPEFPTPWGKLSVATEADRAQAANDCDLKQPEFYEVFAVGRLCCLMILM